MVIEYKIKFEEDGVTIRQNIVPDATGVGDGGGTGVTPDPDDGGTGVTENPDDGGTGVTPNPDDGGGGPGGRGRVAAIVLGPVVVFDGARPAPAKYKGESVVKPPVVPVTR